MDLAFLTGLNLEVFPAYGLLALGVFLILSGKLVPAAAARDEITRASARHEAELARVREDRDARLEAKNDEITRTRTSSDEWRSAWAESQAIAADVRAQNRDLIDSLYFVRKVVGNLPGAGGGESP